MDRIDRAPNGSVEKGGKQQASASASTSLTPAQKNVAMALLGRYDRATLTADQAKSILKALEGAGIQRANVSEALKTAGWDPTKFWMLVQGGQMAAAPSVSVSAPQMTPKPSGNHYVMTAEVKNGINVREKANSESKLLYMLAKVDATHPLITITKMSSDNKWGFMETGDSKKDGWVYMEYLQAA